MSRAMKRSAPRTEPCKVCDGTGKRVMGYTRRTENEVECRACNGKGYVMRSVREAK